MRRAALLLIILACCGPAGKNTNGPAAGRRESEAVKTYPVLRHVPGKATYFLASARLDSATQAVRDLLKPFGRIEQDADPANVDRVLRRELGFSPLSAADLADAGFAIDKNVAIFSTAALPTLAVPVANKEKVTAWVQKMTARAPVVVSETRGVTMSVIRDGSMFWAWAIVDEWMFVHIGVTDQEQPGAWLEEILDNPAPLASEPDLEWARLHAGAIDALGLWRPPAFWAAVNQLDHKDLSAECKAKESMLAGATPRIAVGAALADGHVEAQLFVEVLPVVFAGLDAHVAPAPDGNYLAMRDQAGGVLDLGLDLDWYGNLMGQFATRDCGELTHLVDDLDMNEWMDPSRAMGGARAFTSYHLALLGGSVSFSGVDLQAGGWFGVADEAAARSHLRALGDPQPITVAGVNAQQIAIPSVAEPLRFVFAGGALKAGMGRNVFEQLLATSPAGDKQGDRDLFGFAVRPDKLPDLLGAVSMVGGNDGEMLALVLGEYKWLRAGAVIVTGADNGVRVTAGFELR